jgi:hypothetical protein
MRFYIIFILLLVSIVILSSFLILTLNTDIILIDFLFFEVYVDLGKALLFSSLMGFLVAFILERIGNFIKNRKSN